MFSSKNVISFRLKKERRDILDDMRVSKLSAKVFFKENYTLNITMMHRNKAYNNNRTILYIFCLPR